MATKPIELERVAAQSRAPALDHVVIEEPLAITARGQRVLTVMRTPGHDLDLVRGLLHAEGLPAADLRLVDDAAGNSQVDVALDPARFAPRATTSAAGCGVCGRQTIADLERSARSVDGDFMMRGAMVAALPALLRQHQTVFAQTGGLHGAALADASGELRVVREDVGRHNAVDKVIGWALAEGLAADRHALVVSGRLGYEIVQKAVAWGAPVVVAVSAPSSLAIEVAERFRVALCGFAREDRFNIYSHGWRIA